MKRFSTPRTAIFGFLGGFLLALWTSLGVSHDVQEYLGTLQSPQALTEWFFPDLAI